jgi:Transposase IS116/IS110/IS902 family
MTGTDLTQIDGIDVMAAMTVVSEVGWDMSKWRTENHFVSWLKLCPDNKISGGKVIGKGRMPTNNRATTVLRMAASTLLTSESYLGAQFRRLRTRLGPPVATKAMAAKLARLLYRMLRYGMKYADQGAELSKSRRFDRPARIANWAAGPGIRDYPARPRSLRLAFGCFRSSAWGALNVSARTALWFAVKACPSCLVQSISEHIMSTT